jgi:uncharacterized membrane protein
MDRRTKPRSFAVATIVCLVLLALLAVMQVGHMHPNDNDADHCPLCIVMHTAAPVTVAAVAILMVQIGTRTPILETRAIVRHWHPSLFTRPPPVAC